LAPPCWPAARCWPPWPLFASWTVYALVVAGAGNVLLTQSAYQTGQPMVTLPIIAAVTPLASVAIGIGLLGETPRTGVAGEIVAGLAVLVTCLALARLARSAPHPEPQVHPEPWVPPGPQVPSGPQVPPGPRAYPEARVLAAAGR
jgi:drug/metabolite transporter (DMT)-like permease